MDWNDDQIVAFDFEASGSLPEYALQPWRIPAGDTWATSLAWVHRPTTGEVIIDGGLFPTVAMMRRFLEWVLDEGKIILGWNVVYDIAVMLGYGFEELVMQCRFMDGMLIWRHLDIEPEWDETGRTKRHYGLKLAVDTFLPQYSGYQEDIDFHTDDVEKLTKLHDYNIKDNIFTLRIAKMLWGRLTQRQQQAAIIEAQCLPLVALANYRGMCIDRIAARELSATLKNTAKVKLAKLAPHGVNEIIIRSPTKLAKLMFDDWKLPVLKENKSDKTQKISRSTDKAVLHELAFIDPRAKELREYREALNCDTKFALAPIKASEYCGDDRAHPQAIVYSTYCVPGDVEVLTRNGWVRLDQWQGGEIVQARPDLSMEFLPATRYDGGETSDWVRLKQQSFDCLFTPEHTVPYLAQKTYAWRVQKAGELSNEVKNIPTAGYLRLAGRYTPDQMRLFAAVQADGYFGRYELKFTLKKARKIKRLLQLLMTLGIRYRTYVAAAYPDRLEVHIGKKQQPDWLWKDKKFFGAWLLDTTIDGLATFVEETEFWDGSPHRDGGFKYSSSIKDNVEWVVTVAALVGRKAAIHKTDICGMSECHISDPSQRAIRAITPHYRSRVCETHHAYCPSTETGFWLARSQGHIFITGNTGRLTYASKQGRNKDERPIGWAVHQEKRGAPFRRILVPPPGYDLIEFDAAGQEFRWMAIKSGDPVMLHLCAPGEDPHSYMGAQIAHRDYHGLIKIVHNKQDPGHKVGKHDRQLGKIANLCMAIGTRVLTDRGWCSIERIQKGDLVWDGLEFVSHDGVSFSGVLPVISYAGLTATSDHGVLVDGSWASLEDAARHGWCIEPALGAGWARKCRSAFRIMDGIVRRAIREVRGALCASALRLRDRARCEFALHRDWPFDPVQGLRDPSTSSSQWRTDHSVTSGQGLTEACQRLVSALQQPQKSVMAQLRCAWDRVSLRFSARGRRVGQDQPTTPNLSRAGYRSSRQRWSLRAWKLAPRDTQSEPRQQVAPCYDIVNCGPRTRFATKAGIVHNSLQYRTSAKKLMVVARVDYDIPMVLDEAFDIRNIYLGTYKDVPKYWQRQISLVQSCGYAETLAGRRVKVIGNWSGPNHWRMESTSINYPIQGTGAEQKYLALMMLRDYLVATQSYFMLDLHDGIYVCVPSEKAMKVAVEGKAILDNLPYATAWGVIPSIPLPWDVKIGKTWGDLSEIQLN